MKLREFRRPDSARFFELLKSEFPEEERVVGTRVEGFNTLIARLYRWDMRLLLGFLGVVRRSPFHLYVVEEDGRIAATTLLSFTARAGYLSTVVVAPEFRRRGFARLLIERARTTAAARGKPYVVLGVLAQNAPARALYASVGYQTLDAETFSVHDAPAGFTGAAADGAVRPFDRRDATPLAALANELSPPAVRDVLPRAPRDLFGRTFADRLFSSESAAWVVDRGRGPEAHVAATVSPMTEAAHLSTPIIGPTVEPALATALIRTAGSWLAGRGAVRVVTTVPDRLERARTALAEAGFHDAFPHFTLYRGSR